MADSPPPHGRVLIVAGSDSGGGAGIQGDIKTVSALGGFAMTAITALTAQNTLGVQGIHPVPPAFIAQQMRVVLEDIGADAIKTGMLHAAEVIEAVVGVLAGAATIPLVVDPVMVAKGGASLLDPTALEALVTQLIPHATLITPNLPEAALLLGHAIADDLSAMRRTAETLLKLGAGAVLLKGGHGSGEILHDILVTQSGETLHLTATRRHTRHTHGTGCTFASAIATGLAQGMLLADAAARAHAYVQAAMARAPGFGGGHGPLGH